MSTEQAPAPIPAPAGQDKKAAMWSDHFQQTASAYNARPHETAHGAPEDVERQPATEFRVLQDNADKFQHNKDLTERRVKAAFRAPTNAARSFNPQYGDVQRLGAVDSMTVRSTEGRETHPAVIAFFFSAKPCKKLPTICTDPESARPTKKTGPVKKRMASWARQRQQITEAADGGARARTGADGAVVLNLRRGPGAYALLSRTDGQLTRAGQHYYSHLGLRPPSKDFDYNQPLIREAQRLHPAAQRAEEARALPAGRRAPADQAGQGLLPRQVLRVPGPRAGDHPWQAAQRANAGAGYERRDWLPVNELGGATRHPAHLTEEQVAQRVRQQVEASLDPGGPILSSEGHWVVSTQSTRYRNSRTEVETLLRQRMRGLRSVSFEDKPLCVPRQLAELLQLSVEEVCADFDAMLRHDWRRLGISAEEVRACGATPPCAC